jgi:hypothetical protein
MKTWNRSWLGLIVIVAMVGVGCGPAGPVLAPVEGVVLLEGEPLEGAVVLFQPEGGGKPSTGLTDAAGKFTLTTLEKGDGAYVGANSVAVTKSLPSAAANVEEGEISDVELGSPPRYASPALSGITINVEKGMAPVTLELTWAE